MLTKYVLISVLKRNSFTTFRCQNIFET